MHQVDVNRMPNQADDKDGGPKARPGSLARRRDVSEALVGVLELRGHLVATLVATPIEFVAVPWTQPHKCNRKLLIFKQRWK